MKLISLNIWAGKFFEPLIEFIKKESVNADIFCLQEIFQCDQNIVSNGLHMNIFGELAEVLSDFDGYFLPLFERHDFSQPTDFHVVGGDAIFARRTIPVTDHGSFFIYGNYNDIVVREGKIDFPVALQYVSFQYNNRSLAVAHLHGIVHPGTKLDSPARLEQSRHIVDFLNKQSGEKILCGDFNLMPDTESIRLIEKVGMKNLIKDFNIQTTRNRIANAKYPDDPQRFADYVLISFGISVKSFAVPNLKVSDHLPLVLEF